MRVDWLAILDRQIAIVGYPVLIGWGSLRGPPGVGNMLADRRILNEQRFRHIDGEA